VATTNDLKNGITLNLDGNLWTVVEFQHVKPGKGGAFVRTKLKNVMSGKVVDRTFNAGVKVDVANYLLEEQLVTVAFNDGVPLYVDLPAAVELTVSATEPGLQGDRSTGGTKPAKLETGAEVHVPLFISTGEKVRVDTRTGQYLGRA